MSSPVTIRNIAASSLLILCANTSALPGDEFQPIEIQANSATHHEKTGLTSYIGNVVIRQGSMKLEADSVTVSNATEKRSAHLIAAGHPARFQQQPEADKPVITAQASNISYQPANGTIELVGMARLFQGESQIQSDRITYHVEDQVFRAEGLPASDNNSPQRVQIIIPAQRKPDPTPEPSTPQGN
jgi:lipopolysaccharide export system protein LptA